MQKKTAVERLMEREKLKKLSQARVMTIEGWIGEDTIYVEAGEQDWGAEADGYREAVARAMGEAWEQAAEAGTSGVEVSLELECDYPDPYFSHSGCEACQTGGCNVTNCVGVHQEGERFGYELCHECLLDLNHG